MKLLQSAQVFRFPGKLLYTEVTLSNFRRTYLKTQRSSFRTLKNVNKYIKKSTWASGQGFSLIPPQAEPGSRQSGTGSGDYSESC